MWQLLVWLSLADFFCQHCQQNMATACLAGAQSNNAAILHPGHLRMSAAYKQPATPTSNWINQLFDQGEAASDLSILACDQQFWRSGHLLRGGGVHDSLKYLWSEVYMYIYPTCFLDEYILWCLSVLGAWECLVYRPTQLFYIWIFICKYLNIYLLIYKSKRHLDIYL